MKFDMFEKLSILPQNIYVLTEKCAVKDKWNFILIF